MIIARAPFRISFTGGGSDVAAFYTRHFGSVVSATINKYMYVILHPYFHEKIRIKYSQVEDVGSVEEIRHPIVREALRKFGIRAGLEIASIADVPARTGLGSSGAFTAALLHVLQERSGRKVGKKELAELACTIEIDILGEPIGKQDQYAVSFGGFNYFQFHGDGSVDVEPIKMPSGFARELREHLMLFYVPGERNTRYLMQSQNKALAGREAFETMKRMVKLSDTLRKALKKGCVEELGQILHEGWLLKRSLSKGISNDIVDAHYDTAMRAGARGGKLLGAGGAGFLLLCCKPSARDIIRGALGLRELEFDFEAGGSQIIYSDNPKSS